MATSFYTDVHATNFPWTESPFFDKLLASTRVTPEQDQMLRSYSENGYLILDPEIPAETLKGAIADLEGKYTGRIQDAWDRSRHVKEIAVAPKVLEFLKLLYQRTPIPFQTLNFNVGTEQGTHSDAIHFHSVPQRFMCGVWIALEDVDDSNGPVHYYPGSHKLPVIEMHDLGVIASEQPGPPYAHYGRYVEFLQALIDAHGLKKVDVNLKKGQALIWSANLLHGGSPIRDRNRSRHSQVTHYFFEGCLYYTPLLSDLPIGKAYARSIRNIATGETVSQAYNRVPVTNPGQWPPALLPVDERPVPEPEAPHPAFLVKPHIYVRNQLQQVRSTVARVVGRLMS